MDPTELLNIVRDGGIIGVLIIFLVGGMRGWWVFGRHHDESMRQAAAHLDQMRQDRNFWRDLAVEGVATAKEGVRLAERRHQE